MNRPPKISEEKMAALIKGLAGLLQAALPLGAALQWLRATWPQSDSASQSLLQAWQHQLEQGLSFSSAIKQHRGTLPPFAASLCAAAEQGGFLATALSDLAAWQESKRQAQQAMQNALIAPLFLLLASLFTLALMLFFVLPRFAEVFINMGQAVPPAMQTLLNFSVALQFNLPIFLCFFLLGLIIFWRWQKSKSGAQITSQFSLHLPLLGKLQQQSGGARIGRLLSLMLRGGMALHPALLQCASAEAQPVFAKELQQLADAIAAGTAISAAVKACKALPPALRLALQHGEATGQMANALLMAANLQAECAASTWQQLQRLAPPLITLLLAALVAAMMLILYGSMADLYALAST